MGKLQSAPWLSSELFLHLLPELPLPPSLRSDREGSSPGVGTGSPPLPTGSGEASPSSSLWQVNWISFSKARSQLQEVLCSQGRALVSESAPCLCQGPLKQPCPFLQPGTTHLEAGLCLSVVRPSFSSRDLEATAVVLLLLFPPLLIKQSPAQVFMIYLGKGLIAPWSA